VASACWRLAPAAALLVDLALVADEAAPQVEDLLEVLPLLHPFQQLDVEQPGEWSQDQEKSETDARPGDAPAARLHDGAHRRKRGHEADAHHQRIRTHGQVEPTGEPLADEGQARHRKRALPEAAGERDQHE